MTQERKCFISPQDVSAVRLRCSKCKGASIIPIERLTKNGIFTAKLSDNCPYCGTLSGFTLNTRELAEFADFHILLGKLAAILEGRNIEFSLQVECKDE
jgi:hypothetical protein